MIYILTISILALFLIVIKNKWHLLFTAKKLPILMYHKVLPNQKDKLTVSEEQLEQQFKFLAENGYTSYFFSELIGSIPKKSIILTFDDGFDNNREFVEPLLKKYNLKATFFIPTLKTIEGNFEQEKTMNFNQLKSLIHKHIEIGLHTHSHKKMAELSTEEILFEITENKKYLTQNSISFTNVLAYPYGNYPKGSSKKIFFELLKQLDIQYALRIGNTINAYPFRKPFEIHRIDCKGTDSFDSFKLKLRFGKTTLF